MVPWDLVTVEREKAEAPAPQCARCDLDDLAFCAGLSLDQSRRFHSIVNQIEVGPHEALFHEGDDAAHLFTVTRGAVKLYKLLADGRRQITAFLFPGDVFGLANGGSYAYTAESLSPVCLCRFPRRKLEALFVELPILEKRLLGAATHELVAAQEQMLLLGRMTARERVASFILALWNRLGPECQFTGSLDLPMSRSDIADFLGLTIETVSRTLTRLKRDGLIGLADANHLIVCDEDGLAEIAEGD